MSYYSPSYGHQNPEISNNPFVNDPTNAGSRYPDLSGSLSSSSIPQDPSSSQYTSWQQSNNNSQMNGYMAGAPQPGQFQSYGQQQYAQMQAQPTGYPNQSQSQFGYQQQPQSPMQYGLNGGFQQQQQPQLHPSYSYLQPQQQQMQTQQMGYQDVAQFDPYGPIASGQWGEQSQTQPQSQATVNQSQPSSASTSTSTYQGHLHPREFIRTRKAELEIWDPYAWKQVLNEFDFLKDAWAARRKEVEQRIVEVKRDYGYTGLGEVGRLEAVGKEAGNNSDSVAASSYQMHEVFQGYRQSGDLASKKRVREATNAALSNLPDWPAQNF